MNNKLVSVIIDNPYQKSWGYRSRDMLITMITLILWGLVMAKVYMFFIVEEAFLEQLYGSVMIKLLLVGFVITFLTFHCWAVYNQYLYTSYLKRQLRHFQQPTLELESDDYTQLDRRLATEHTIREHELIGTPSQATN
jgi:small-conductance mechanosensitive channel